MADRSNTVRKPGYILMVPICQTNVPLSGYVILGVMQPYIGKGRNITTDNFFMSLKLAKQLQDRKTSLVGTVNSIRRELPPSALDLDTECYSSRLLKHSGCTLTVYKCKPRKNVILMSTLHPSIAIGNDAKKIPETVQFYNSTKFGVDIVDQMSQKYSVKAGSRRWPVQVFYNIMDLAAINSWILYKETTGKWISRRNYILQLAEELQLAHLRKVQIAKRVADPTAETGDCPAKCQ
ncbi:uncharacterized protein LOC121313928 [Polyodon spathula]|uniref:uncharacterized protein LOC121313928 n=1 Tax=Polyodon spathula TaxID=7913 RepID=UPI001B7E040D|nr:uncharacterized protein LOC121313928 [Polyodon spathula]